MKSIITIQFTGLKQIFIEVFLGWVSMHVHDCKKGSILCFFNHTWKGFFWWTLYDL